MKNALAIGLGEIFSSSDVTKSYSKCRDLTKKNKRTFIFKNNKPDLVMLDISEYERIQEKLNLLEDLDIALMLNERMKNDSGKRYSMDDIAKKYNLKRE